MNLTLDDLVRIGEIYDDIMNRADRLLEMQAKVTGRKNVAYTKGIDEFYDGRISFICEDRFGDTEYESFLLEDFVSDDYLKRFEKQYEEELEKERIMKEEKNKENALRTERIELETLKRLKEKYPDQ